ncbi:uncharacterized protein cubi_01511 [Cryptosporidium ubiquitum]|uniref:Uncharacterized protein n=1 Tax=Cryptosporidium ubiquitum TaxID=857276 RepID=A0A1J4MD58_9CRYT|nr:uncharacterized protein cubi_01511 [Cryptosporidium ubiquitum]OII72178.1 hypothetical protein cubi_01511 [Cryptosporidium ubiquitum]
MIINRYLIMVLVVFLGVFFSLTEKLTCSVVMKLFGIIKRQKEKFKPYEERTPKISKQSELSEFEKRQLYWYYKDFIGRREVNKIWKDEHKGKYESNDVTDEEIFSGKSFIPIRNGFSRLGKQIPNNLKNVTPAVFNTQLGGGMIEKSNVIFYRGDNMLNLDSFGNLKREDKNVNKTKIDTEVGIKSFKNRKTLQGGNYIFENKYVWASIVSPCDGELQFDMELEESLNFRENRSLYIIYCINGSVRERYSRFKGRVIEFLNGRLNSENLSRNSKLDLNQKFSVRKGEIILRILENYYPPIFESDLIAIPIFMPCNGRVAWGKEHRKVFVKGEQIIEFICIENDKIIAKHLVSPSRGYTESLQQHKSGEKTQSLLDQSFNSSLIQTGDPLGVMWLELNTIALAGNRFSGLLKETLIRMPCNGRLEYPISESSFVLKNEILYIVICNDNKEVIMEQSPIQGVAQLLVLDNIDLIKKNVYFLRLDPLDISEMPPLNRNPKIAKHKFDLSLIKEADPMSPLYIERIEIPEEI